MTRYVRRLEAGEKIFFTSVDPEEFDIELGKVYTTRSGNWGGVAGIFFIDEDGGERQYPLTPEGEEDGYVFEILVLENE